MGELRNYGAGRDRSEHGSSNDGGEGKRGVIRGCRYQPASVWGAKDMSSRTAGGISESPTIIQTPPTTLLKSAGHPTREVNRRPLGLAPPH